MTKAGSGNWSGMAVTASGQEPVNYWQRRQQIISVTLTYITGLGHLSLYGEV